MPKASRAWLVVSAVLGAAYALIGIAFALPTTNVRAWRLAAWGASAIGFGAHILHERVRLKRSPSVSALHVAVGAAIGAFGLAVGANIHAQSIGATEHRQILLLSLGIWPIITAIPAFLVALVASVILRSRGSIGK